MDLFSRELGEGSPLIILHGLFGTSDNWLTLAKRYAETYKVFLIDQRNHGASPHSNEFSYPAMANDLHHFIQQKGLSEVNIIGHSMGGKTAMEYALGHEHTISKLIVVDIAPKFYPVHHDKILQGLSSIDLESISSRKEADSILSKYVPESGIRAFLLKNLTRTEERKFAWKINLPIITKEIETVGAAMNSQLKFAKRALFVDGGKSDYITNGDEVLIGQMFPNSEIVTVSQAGHWVHAEKPDQFFEITMSFLSDK